MTATHRAFEESSENWIAAALVHALRESGFEADFMTWPVASSGATEAIELLRTVDLDRCPLGYPIDALVSLDGLTAFLRHGRNVSWFCSQGPLSVDQSRRLCASGAGPSSVLASSEALARQARRLGFRVADVVELGAWPLKDSTSLRSWTAALAQLGLYEDAAG